VKPPRCEWEQKTLAAIRSRKTNSGIAKHAQACQICSEIMLVTAFLRRLQLRDWQLLWQAYVKGSTHEQVALAMNLRTETIRRRLSLTRSKLAALIRVRFRPSQEVPE
jgi:DNA-directed RNA polymerase specialized sigma24 family protein